MAFVLGYCAFGLFRIIKQLSWKERRKLAVSLITPETVVKNIRDIFCDCLFHVKLWKRNKLLGYMHSSIAFGWFMLIVLGHLEVILFVPKRINLFYYPIFFNYFVAEDEITLRGSLLFFLMDFFLLVVLSGIVLAMIKRVSSRLFGMRRTARPSFLNLVGLYALWAIFPLRLLAESFTAHISGGSFLTIPANWVFRQFLGNELNMLPTWWAYSIALGVFMCVLPFTRYMHIPAEMLLIPMRNAGLKMVDARKGFTRVQVLSCPNCGVCVDACPMSANRANLKDCTVYLTRQVRRGNERRIEQISDKCLMCGKCKEVCQVGVDGAQLRLMQRARRQYGFSPDFSNLPQSQIISSSSQKNEKVLYFGGCMTQLTPAIGKSVESILRKSGVDYEWMDREGGICCGRPLYTAGRTREAEQLVQKNQEIIKNSGAKVLLVSCPICYKMFLEHYDLNDIRVVHYVPFMLDFIASGKIQLIQSEVSYVFHDPCELGRGCGMYDEPRQLLKRVAQIREAEKNREMSVCCGGSLGSLSLDFAQREKITRASLDNLCGSGADAIATACPLCKTTFSRYSDRPVRDLAEIVDELIIDN
ncbi:MAG: (Fe-S)-binding protein [Bacteroidales bacterium]|nr:(Fe-S)-binding protein [Candidatus Colimorpha pelethequi]